MACSVRGKSGDAGRDIRRLLVRRFEAYIGRCVGQFKAASQYSLFTSD
jgi:hypothetical protein